MQDYNAQLPKFKEWIASTGGDPTKVATSFPAGITNPQLVKEIGDLQLASSRSLAVEAKKAQMIDDYKLITEARRSGFRISDTPTDDELAAAGQFVRQQRIAEAKAKQTDTLVTKTDDLEKARVDYEQALTTKNPATIAAAKSRYETMQGLAIPTNETIETGVDAEGHPTVKITRGKQATAATPDTLTTAVKSKVLESQAQSLATIDVANRLEPLISSETVGLKAFAGSILKDRVLAQAFPDLANKDRIQSEQLAAQLRASSVKELRSDGNITEGERKQILEAIPSINDPIDSPARAKELVRDVRKMAAIRAMVATKRLGGEVPKAAAMVLDDDSLAKLYEQGLITQDQAKQAYQSRPSF